MISSAAPTSPPARTLTLREAIARFRAILVGEGLLAAMRFANARSVHRFTAIYWFDGPTLRNLLLVDADDPGVTATPDLPVLESYCVFVRETSSAFLTDASLGDPRVARHPKREVVQSYCGIPLMTLEGTLYGTLCHFDYHPRAFTDDEVAFLEAVAPMIMRAIADGAAEDLLRPPARA